MKVHLLHLLKKLLTLWMVLVLSGCSDSLFIPIVEEKDEEETETPVTPSISTGFSLSADGLYLEKSNDTTYIYTNSETGEITFTLTADSSDMEWSKYTTWEGDSTEDKPTTPSYSLIDFGDTTSADLTYTTSSTNEGEYEVNILLQNDSGDESDVVTVNIELDRTAPEYDLTINGSSNDTTTASTDISVKFSANDGDDTYDDYYQMKIWRSDEEESSANYETFSVSVSETITETEGSSYYFSSYIQDRAGNISAQTTSPTLTYSTTTPSFTFTINDMSESATTTQSNVISIYTDVTYLPSSSETVYIAIWDSGETEPLSYTTVKSGDSFSHTLSGSNGDYSIYVAVKQVSSSTVSQELRYDNEAPTITGFTLNGSTTPDSTSDSTPEIGLTYTDNLADDSDMYIKIWTGDEDDGENEEYQSLSDYEIPEMSEEGTITYWSQLQDDSENESDRASCSITYATIPTVTVTINNDDDETNNNEVDLTLTIPVDVTGYKAWEGSEEDEPTGDFDDLDDYGETTAEISYTLSSFTEGENSTVYVKVQDGAGNESDTASDSIGYDSIVSQPAISLDQGDVTSDNTVDLTLTADSDVTEMKLWLGEETDVPDDSEYITYTSSVTGYELFSTEPTESTSYSFYLIVKDDADNTTESSPVVTTITYDSETPSLELTTSVNYTTDVLTASTTITTNSGDITDVKFWLTSESDDFTDETEDGTSWDESETGSSITPSKTWDMTTEDTYTVHVMAKNTAGLTSTVTSSIIYDVTAPELDSTVIEVDSNTVEYWTQNSEGTIDLTLPTITDNMFETTALEMIYYIYSLDDSNNETEEANSGWISYSTSVNDVDLDSHGDGDYIIRAYFRDETGNSTADLSTPTFAETPEFHLDRVAPALSLNIDGDENTCETNEESVTVDLILDSELGEDSLTIVYAVDGSTTSPTDTTNSSTWSEWDNYSIGTGEENNSYTFSVTLTDQAGNESTDTLSVTYDGIAPTITSFSLGGDDLTNESSVTITYEIFEDETSGQVRFSNSDTNDSTSCDWTDWMDTSSNDEDTYSWDLNDTDYSGTSSDGDKYVFMQVRDTAGNGDVTVIETSSSVYYDSTNPNAEFFTIEDDPDALSTDYTNDNTLSITVDSVNNDSDPPVYIAFWDDGTSERDWAEIKDNSNYAYDYESTTSHSYTLSGSSGAYTVYCRVYDEAGNSAQSSEMIYLDLDTPSVDFTINGNTAPDNSSNSEVELIITSTDSMGTYGYTVTNDLTSGSIISSSETTTGTQGDSVETVYTLDYELDPENDYNEESVSYTISVIGTDYVGNASSTTDYTITIDKEGPEQPTVFMIYDEVIESNLTTLISYYISDIGTASGTTDDGDIYISITTDDTSAETIKFWYTEGQSDSAVSYQEIVASGYYTMTLPSTGEYTIHTVVYDSFENPSDDLTCIVTYE
jgi:hypothetical protein